MKEDCKDVTKNSIKIAVLQEHMRNVETKVDDLVRVCKDIPVMKTTLTALTKLISRFIYLILAAFLVAIIKMVIPT